MLNLAEHRKKPQALADFLPWAALVAPGVIANKDGSFQRAARFRGPDLDSATPAELVSTTARLNGALRRLGSGWAVFVEAQRVPANRYPRSRFSGCGIRSGGDGAAVPVRGGGRALRERLFPHLRLAAAGGRCRSRRGLAVREPRGRGRGWTGGADRLR